MKDYAGGSSRSEKNDGFLEILKLFKALRVGKGEADTERSKKLEQLEKLFRENSELIFKFKSFTLKDQGDACVKLLSVAEEVAKIVKELKNKNEREALFKFDEFKSMVQVLYQWVQHQTQAQKQASPN
jgi:hypothetical protein